MKKLLLIALFVSAACIDWPSTERLRERRCATAPNDPQCEFLDAGVDSGVSDAGLDAGPVDAGPWSVVWRTQVNLEARFLVGDGMGGTLVSRGGAQHSFQAFTRAGAGVAQTRPATQVPTAAYEREGRLSVAFSNGRIELWQRNMGSYSSIASNDLPFVSTAMNLYFNSFADSGVAVAAYGDWDGGLGLSSFSADPELQGFPGSFRLNCAPATVIRPQRLLATPDGGPGVVVGNLSGSCMEVSTPRFLPDIDAGAFVARFGGPIADGYGFVAEPNSPMTIGVVDNDVRLIFRPRGGQLDVVAVGSDVGDAGLSRSTPVLVGNLTPIDLVDVGADSVLVGFASGNLSLPDGGFPFTTDQQDVFFARLNANFEVVNLHVFVAPGDQTAVGAVWLPPQLVVGGTCSGVAAGVCQGTTAGQSWLAAFE
ncbi:MAG: hypothetical protein JNM17_33085 [Archangium sp.]|nr:hypothetical protein [Archangium sp.]